LFSWAKLVRCFWLSPLLSRCLRLQGAAFLLLFFREKEKTGTSGRESESERASHHVRALSLSLGGFFLCVCARLCVLRLFQLQPVHRCMQTKAKQYAKVKPASKQQRLSRRSWQYILLLHAERSKQPKQERPHLIGFSCLSWAGAVTG
jgi:hypothetical protein